MNPSTGAAGRDVTIQGFRFQPNSNVAIDVGGITATNVRTNEKGEFTTNIYMPVAGEGARNVNAYDDTGNYATASFYTEFGFDTIQRSIEELQRQIAQGTGAPAAPDATAPTAPSPAPSSQPLPSPPSESAAAPSRPVLGAMGGLPVLGGWGGLALGAGAYAVLWVRRRRGES